MSGRRDAGSGLARYVPAAGWLGGYQRSWLRGDLAAGLTTAAVVIPQAMAYATIAGLPVQVGLYVATVPMLVYALLGTSRPLSVSTTSTLAALTAAAVASAAGGDPDRALVAASTLAALSGALLLADLRPPLAPPSPAMASIAILLGLRRWGPRSLPGPLLVVGLGIVLAVTTGLADRGVALVGAVPPGLPQLAAPDLALVGQLIGPAAGVALMAFVESIAAARAFTAPDDPEVDADQELRALGTANLAGGFFQAFPAGGGLSQTAVNRGSGARSQLAGIATAQVVVLTLLFLTPLFENLPQATLGAVVMVAVAGLVDPAALGRIRLLRFRDFVLGVVALAGVLVLGVLDGVLLAVVVSMLTLIHGTNHPPIEVLGRRPGSGHWRSLERHPDGETVPGLLVLRPVAAIYFGNGPRVRKRLLDLVDAADRPPRVLLLDLDAVPDIDVTALDVVASLDAELRRRGITLWLTNLNARPLDMLRRLPDAGAWEPRLFREPDDAAVAFSARPPRGAR